MLTKEISEVEKEIEQEFKMLNEGYGSHEARDRNIDLLRAKLSTLKSAQAKFDKFVEDLKASAVTPYMTVQIMESQPKEKFKLKCFVDTDLIDELSSKQEGKMSNYSKEKAIKELNRMNFKYGNLSNKYAELKAKFNKFVEDLKTDIKKMSPTHEVSKEMLLKRIDELSSKQEGKE
jgi:hypothetical protein